MAGYSAIAPICSFIQQWPAITFSPTCKSKNQEFFCSRNLLVLEGNIKSRPSNVWLKWLAVIVLVCVVKLAWRPVIGILGV